MKRLLFVTFLIVSLEGFSQQTETDSLTARLQENLHDTDRVKALNILGWSLKHDNPDTASMLVTQALSLAETIPWKSGIANSAARLGVLKYLQGDFSEALEYYTKALKVYKETSDELRTSRILGNIGNVHLDQGNYARALEYFFQGLKINEELGQQSDISISNNNIGIVYMEQADYPKALEYFFKALKIDRELDRKVGIAIRLGNIGNVYSYQDNYQRALEYYFKALKIDEDLGRKKGIAIRLGNIGTVYDDQGDSAVAASQVGRNFAMTYQYPKALEYYYKALKMDEELGNQYGISRHLGNLGSLYRKTGEFEKAEVSLQKAIALSKTIGSKQSTKLQYDYLTKLYDTIGNPALAFQAYKQYIIYSDSLSNEENTKAQTRSEMKYEFEKQELVQQQQEKETRRLADEATSRRDNLQYSVILIAILVLFGGVLSLGYMKISPKMAEGIIFFSFLIVFEFLLVLADPLIENWSGGAPGIKLLFNAGIAALIFPLHAFFETTLKSRMAK